MSTVKTNNVQIGQSATASNNFVLSVPNVPDGSLKISRGNVGATTQDLIVVGADNSVSIPGNGEIVGTTDTQTLTNKTLTDPILSLNTTQGTIGQVPVSQGPGLPPVWSNVLAGATMTGDLTLNAQSDLRYADADSSNWVAFQAPATVVTNVTWTLPDADGTSGQVLQTNGSGTLSWSTPSSGDVSGPASAVSGNIATFDGTTGKLIQDSALAVTDIATLNTAQTFTALKTFSGSTSVAATKLTNAKEVTTISATAATGTIDYDVTTQSVLYYTSNASANWTVNFRGSSGTSLDTLMSTGESITVAFLVTQGATAYYNSAVQVDGSSVTPKWQGGTAPTAGNASGVDAYTYTIVKTGSATFTVFAAQTQFK